MVLLFFGQLLGREEKLARAKQEIRSLKHTITELE